MLAYEGRSRLCRQQQGIDGADRAVGITEADFTPPHIRGSVGTTVDSGIPIENALCQAQSRETDWPTTSGDEIRWPSDESPVLRVRPLN